MYRENLQIFVFLTDTEDSPSLDDTSLSALALSFVTHGLDETASAAAVAAYEAHRRPRVMRRLEEELETALDKCGGNLDYDTLVKNTSFPYFCLFDPWKSEFRGKGTSTRHIFFLTISGTCMFVHY